ncbi:MAG TPA: DUF58 domain-containing protein [Thermoguttaceae bacterium]|nr:DUF58 domain-containing protein [Thermoguttaceae bacterium]
MSLASIAKPLRTTVCRETWYYLAVFVAIAGAAMFRDINLLLVLAGMIAGPLWLSWRMVGANLRGLQLSRRVPQGVSAGDLLVVNLELTNTRRRGSWAVAAEDQVRRVGRDPLRPCVYFAYTAGGQRIQQAYRGRLVERGLYEIGPLRLSTRFPFGLLRRTTLVGRRESLVVFPRLGRLTQAWLARHHEAFEGAQQRQQRFSRVEGQFYGVRYWRNGDSRRSIHWRSSARQGQLVVRQYEQPRNRDMAVLVDLWRPGEPTRDDRDHVELAVSFAATVVAELCRKGNATIWLATTAAPREAIGGSTSPVLLGDCMRRLATAEAGEKDRLAEMLEDVLDRINQVNEIVLVTTRPVDWDDSRRFGHLTQDPARAAALRRIRVVNASDATLGRYFQVE